MAAPTIKAGAAITAFGTYDPIVITVASSTPAENDILNAVLILISTITVTPPSGWALKSSTGQYAEGYLLRHYVKRAGAAGESTTYSFDLSSDTVCAGIGWAVAGADTSGTASEVVEAISPNQSTTGTSSLVGLSVTTVDVDRLLVKCGRQADGGTMTPPASFTEVLDGDGGTFMSWINQAAAGASGNKTTTSTASQPYATFLMAFRPPASGTVVKDLIMAGMIPFAR